MRRKLRELNGLRITCTGVVAGFGTVQAYRGLPEPTVVLEDLKNERGEALTDHLWFVMRKQFQELGLKVGDRIQLDGRVKAYEKGYKGRKDYVYKPVELDYKLSNPSKMVILSRGTDDAGATTVDEPPQRS